MSEINKIPVKIISDQTIENSQDKALSPISVFEDTAPVKKKFSKFSKFFIFIIVFLVVGLTAFSTQIIMSGQSLSNNLVANFSFLGQLKNLAVSAERPLKGEELDRTNIVLLGIGGKGHDGAYLTDTIMVGSLKPSTKQVGLISIPRDLTVPIEGYGWRKVNNINAFAEKQKEGSGGLAVSQALSKILNTPIDYYVRVDFQGFINIIDIIGGVDVNVENVLDDYSYPVLGKEDDYPLSSRYEHLHFDIGLQHMDGSTALKYARSRHAYGKEGSDFARARRQQLIMEAVKDKLLSARTLLNPATVTDILSQLQDHMSTNLSVWELIKIWNVYKDVKKENIINKVLDTSPEGLLVNDRSADGAYILTPKSGDFGDIQYMIANVFSTVPTPDKDRISEEKPTIQVLNGTWVNGLAAKTAMDLEKYGFKVTRVANSSHKNFETSLLYDMTDSKKPESINLLKNKIVVNMAYGLPQWLTDDLSKCQATEGENYEQPDFILILGKDQDKTNSGLDNPVK